MEVRHVAAKDQDVRDREMVIELNVLLFLPHTVTLKQHGFSAPGHAGPAPN